MQLRSPFKPKFGNNGHICVAVAVAVLVAKGPFHGKDGVEGI